MNIQCTPMSAAMIPEPNLVRSPGAGASPGLGNYVVHWHSAFGTIIIEVREGRVFVNGDEVKPADANQQKDSM
jgi:hypothetical protein